MKRMAQLLFTAIAMFVLAFALMNVTAHAGRTSPARGSGATNGAFRDGLYLGTLDARQGREPHLSIGRWNSEIDRAAFVSGYNAGYGQVSGSVETE